MFHFRQLRHANRHSCGIPIVSLFLGRGNPDLSIMSKSYAPMGADTFDRMLSYTFAAKSEWALWQ